MNEENGLNNGDLSNVYPCPVDNARSLPQLQDEPVDPCVVPDNFYPIIKVPAVLAETTIQIVVEADISLDPPASEIKRVHKDVFLTQCKLVPVRFDPMDSCDGSRRVTRAKLFVEGFIRKDFEYATDDCIGVIYDRIASVPFTGFADLNGSDFILYPIITKSSESQSRFINPKNSEMPRLDKYFFENSTFYNEQPYCELVRAEFFELDYSPCLVDMRDTFDTLTEKMVVDLTLKVLQIRQVRVRSEG